MFACEWNRHAVRALKLNLEANGVERRCELLYGDCRKVAPTGVADRVLLGLLPSSRGGWLTAIAALKPSGGWLHLHHNVKDSEMHLWCQQTLQELREMALEMQRDWNVTLHHLERVKSYAPHIQHVVLDILCRQSPQGPSLTTSESSAERTGISVVSSPSRDQFRSQIVASRVPCLIQGASDLALGSLPRCMFVQGMDFGEAVEKWTAEYLMAHPEARETQISAHVCTDSNGWMNFVHRNFQFHTLSFSELIQRCAQPTALPPLIQSDERYYLRSIGKNPRKERSWLHHSFPVLAEDIKLPSLVDETELFSTVLRVSSAGLQLWTHFDVMDNLLLQIRGQKRIKLWAPTADASLYVTGSSSEVMDVESLHQPVYPDFKPPCCEMLLEEGQMLYIPALWFHNVRSETFSISVNVFFRHLPEAVYDRRDLYGNRDLIPAQEASKMVDGIVESLSVLPSDYRSFYTRRLMRRLESAMGLDAG